jgi:uncharacterized membrane protein YsdA (DUF1294 family)
VIAVSQEQILLKMRGRIMGRRTRPEVYHGGLAVAITLGLVGLLFLVFHLPATWYHFAAAWLLAANLTTFAYYGYDKARARATRSRVPEVVLHAMVLMGGSVGAYLGMRLFRHKTIKASFRMVFWLIVVLQIGLAAAVVYRLWPSRS